ncbi:MAG: hypothetical protein WA882_16955, partial [Geitlerinemataceae cyanobacterium]
MHIYPLPHRWEAFPPSSKISPKFFYEVRDYPLELYEDSQSSLWRHLVFYTAALTGSVELPKFSQNLFVGSHWQSETLQRKPLLCGTLKNGKIAQTVFDHS